MASVRTPGAPVASGGGRGRTGGAGPCLEPRRAGARAGELNAGRCTQPRLHTHTGAPLSPGQGSVCSAPPIHHHVSVSPVSRVSPAPTSGLSDHQ